jgi:hypothetical protein
MPVGTPYISFTAQYQQETRPAEGSLPKGSGACMLEWGCSGSPCMDFSLSPHVHLPTKAPLPVAYESLVSAVRAGDLTGLEHSKMVTPTRACCPGAGHLCRQLSEPHALGYLTPFTAQSVRVRREYLTTPTSQCDHVV